MASEWTPEDGRKRLGRPKMTWQYITKELSFFSGNDAKLVD